MKRFAVKLVALGLLLMVAGCGTVMGMGAACYSFGKGVASDFKAFANMTQKADSWIKGKGW